MKCPKETTWLMLFLSPYCKTHQPTMISVNSTNTRIADQPWNQISVSLPIPHKCVWLSTDGTVKEAVWEMYETTSSERKEDYAMRTSWEERNSAHKASLEFSKHECHQIKRSGQIRHEEFEDNFHLQCKHVAVSGLSRALPRKSAQSTKKKKIW